MKEENLNLLQLFYAGALVDTANNYAQHGVMDRVLQKKKQEQKLAATGQLLRLGVTTPEQLFEKMKQVFGCVNWQVESTAERITARSDSCLMCVIARKSGAARPCELFCINPMKAFGEAMTPAKTLTVEKTLWEEDACVFTYR